MGKIEMTRNSTVLAILASLASLSIPFPASALVITEAGHYVVDTRVDGIYIDNYLLSTDVSIEVVSGGVVEGDIQCGSYFYADCDYDATVSGTGVVLGRMVTDHGTIEIRDNARVGVTGANFSGGGMNGRVVISDNAFVGRLTTPWGSGGLFEINGGYVADGYVAPEGMFMSITDGIIGSNIFGEYVQLEMSGGAILGDVASLASWGTNPLDIDMRGGYITGDLNGGGINGVITGGAIDGDLFMSSAFSTASLDISGGLFGLGNSDPLWRVGGAQDLNVYGLDLMFQDGILSGYLRDGSYLNVGIEFTPYWSGEFNYYNVPEPGALALMGIGLAGIGLARRRRVSELQ